MFIKARKSRNAEQVALLSTILGDFAQIDSSIDPKITKLTEAERHMKVIVRMHKAAGLCENEAEVEFLSLFLPTKMSKDEIYGALDKLGLPEGSGIGAYMGAWNKSPDLKGKADMKLVGEVIRESFL